MRISLLISSSDHPVNEYLEEWIKSVSDVHEVSIIRRISESEGGDILFLISCTEIVSILERKKYRYCLVLHASDLPNGKGWSPHIWELSEGAEYITLSLIDAEDKLDSGRIWKKLEVPIPEHCLWNEINELVFAAEIRLVNFAIRKSEQVKPVQQNSDIPTTYYRRRVPSDSRIDPNLSIAEQFNLIRVCDPNRFPAYFELHGHRYILKLEKKDYTQ